MASVSAFFLSGRFIRMVRMPSASVTITCSVIKCIRFPLHRPQPGSRSRSWLDRWAAKNRAVATEQGRLPPSRLKSPRPIGRSQRYTQVPQRLGSPLIALLTPLSFVRGIYSDSVIRRRLDRGPDVRARGFPFGAAVGSKSKSITEFQFFPEHRPHEGGALQRTRASSQFQRRMTQRTGRILCAADGSRPPLLLRET